jgi:hypothetical protein
VRLEIINKVNGGAAWFGRRQSGHFQATASGYATPMVSKARWIFRISWGRGVFAAWNDASFFARVHLDASGAISWDDEIDLCPDALYLMLTHKSPEDLFPNLKTAGRDA